MAVASSGYHGARRSSADGRPISDPSTGENAGSGSKESVASNLDVACQGAAWADMGAVPDGAIVIHACIGVDDREPSPSRAEALMMIDKSSVYCRCCAYSRPDSGWAEYGKIGCRSNTLASQNFEFPHGASPQKELDQKEVALFIAMDRDLFVFELGSPGKALQTLVSRERTVPSLLLMRSIA